MKTLVRHMREILNTETGDTYLLNKRQYLDLRNAGEPVVISQNSGYTEALAYNDSGKLIASSKAYCNPNDTFSRKIGRAIATGRLKKKLCNANQHKAPLDLGDFVRMMVGLGAFDTRLL